MLVCFALWFQFEHNGVHICPGFERAPNLIVHFVWCLYHAEQGQWEPSSGAAYVFHREVGRTDKRNKMVYPWW